MNQKVQGEVLHYKLISENSIAKHTNIGNLQCHKYNTKWLAIGPAASSAK